MKKRLISIFVASAFVASLLFLAGCQATNSSDAAGSADTIDARTIAVFKTEGDQISVAKENEKKYEAKEGVKLFEGYSLSTGKNSYAYLKLDGESVVKVDEETELQISKLNDKNLSINVLGGGVSVDAAPQKAENTLEVGAGKTALAVRGTLFVVEYNHKGNSGITMLAGSGMVGDVSLTTGNMVTISEDGAEEPVPVPITVSSQMSGFILQTIQENKQQLLDKGAFTEEDIEKIPEIIKEKQEQASAASSQSNQSNNAVNGGSGDEQPTQQPTATASSASTSSAIAPNDDTTQTSDGNVNQSTNQSTNVAESTRMPAPTVAPAPHTLPPMPTAETTAAPQPKPIPSVEPTPSAIPTATPKPSATPSATPKPSATPSATPSGTPKPSTTPSGTPGPSATPSPSASPTPSALPTVQPASVAEVHGNQYSSVKEAIDNAILTGADVTVIADSKIDAAESAVLTNGAKLLIEAGKTLILEGTLNVASGSAISVPATSVLSIDGTGTMQNQGTLNVTGTMEIKDNATVANSSSINIPFGGQLNNRSAASNGFVNSATVSVSGQLTNTGSASMLNTASGKIMVQNSGSLNNTSSAMPGITNNKTIENSGTFLNEGYLFNNVTLKNTNGNLTNGGTIINGVGATIANTGGNVYNHALITNKGTYTNTGCLYNTGIYAAEGVSCISDFLSLGSVDNTGQMKFFDGLIRPKGVITNSLASSSASLSFTSVQVMDMRTNLFYNAWGTGMSQIISLDGVTFKWMGNKWQMTTT